MSDLPITDLAGLLTADDLAAHFKVTRRRVIEWNNQHAWPCVRVGNVIRWTPEQVEQIKAHHTITPQGVKPADGRTAKSARRSA